MANRLTVGLVVATDPEARPFLSRLGLRRAPCRGLSCLRGRWAAADIVYATSGMGKTNAAHATAALIRDYSPDMIINFGAGGGYPDSGLGIGDIAVASVEVYADEGVILHDGFRTLETTGIPLARVRGRRYFNEFPLDRILVRKALRSAMKAGHAEAGVFATVSACSGTREQALLLQARLKAICENMEGAAVAHICRLYNVPFAEIRGISNIVEERDPARWDIPMAAEAAARAVLNLLDEVAVAE